MGRFTLIFILLFAGSLTTVYGQEAPVWRGLVFDETTIESAIAAVGKPAKRREEDLTTFSTVSKKAVGDTKVQTIVYEKMDGWEKVALSFFHNKLFRVKFWPRNKTKAASTLRADYQADFVSVEGFSKNVSLSVFDGQKEPAVPRVYPTVYFMVAAKPDRFVVASINNGSFGALWKDAMRKPTVQQFPGYVEDIEILSRKVETN